MIQAMGRSDISLKLEIIKKAVTVICLIWSIRYGVFAVAVCALPLSIFSLLVNSFPNKSLFKLSISDAAGRYIPGAVDERGDGMLCFFSRRLAAWQFLKLSVQLVTGGMIYLFLSVLTHNQSFIYVKTRAIGLCRKKRERTGAVK